MPSHAKRRRPIVIRHDEERYWAMPGTSRFTPTRPPIDLDEILAAAASVEIARARAQEARARAAAAREVAIAAEWAFHDAIQGVRQAVRDQYGPESPEAYAVGAGGPDWTSD
jgi:hypothetical protein